MSIYLLLKHIAQWPQIITMLIQYYIKWLDDSKNDYFLNNS